jgi:hypothetical protein
VVSFSDLTPKSTTGNVPVIGDIIPSRWAYEALAVTSYTDNEYEAQFFDIDKEKYENQYYNMGFLYELQSQLETMQDEKKRGKEIKPEHMEVIRTNLPTLTDYCQMKPYQGDYSYQSLHTYMDEVEHLLAKRSNEFSLKADALMSRLTRQIGKEAVLELKRNNYNTKLEDLVIGADQKRMLDIIDGHIVARTGLIFLTPRNNWGRAPFYSSEKIIGSWHVKTLWFNLGVLLLMCILTATILFNKNFTTNIINYLKQFRQ